MSLKYVTWYILKAKIYITRCENAPVGPDLVCENEGEYQTQCQKLESDCFEECRDKGFPVEQAIQVSF